jgi:hypothetical protein
VRKKTLLAAVFISVLPLSVIAGTWLTKLAEANPFTFLPNVVIKSDGTLYPSTELIKQSGSSYSVTGNISQEFSIVVQCSNIVLDGMGYVLDVGKYANRGLVVEAVTNVTIKDLSVNGDCIWLDNSSNCVILRANVTGITLRNSNSNIITESYIDVYGMHIFYSNSNTIFRNTVVSAIPVEMVCSHANTIFSNNFWWNDSRIVAPLNEANSWDNGSMGNYWNDYSTKYPNATEQGVSEIGDTPYVINANNQDKYPLLSPVEISDPSQSKPFPIIIVAISIVSINVVGVGLLVFFKKRKH